MAFENTTAGDMTCRHCGHAGKAKVNKKGHLYFYCAHPADGGCGVGSTSRSEKGDGIIAAEVKKWHDPAAREHFMQWAANPPSPAQLQEDEELEEETGEPGEPPPTPQTPPLPPPRNPPKPSPRRNPPKPAPKAKPWYERDL